MSEKVSIYDIAKHLNISPATVSYVINGVDKVSKKTKEEVLKAIDELGYVPNYSARAVATGKTHLIGVILPVDNASIAFLQNPFYVEFLGGFEKAIENYNYDICIAVYKKETDVKEWIKKRGLDGLAMLGSYEKKVLDSIKDTSIPIVLTDEYSDLKSDFNLVKSSDEDGMFEATKYLIDNGFNRIGFVGYPSKYPVDKYRYKGYLKALKEAKIEYKDEYLYETGATFDEGYSIGEKIISNNNVDAIVCSGDILAIGIMKKIMELGFDIPSDLSIIGYDDIQDANFVYPGLTTVHQDIFEKGYRSAQILIDILENNRKGTSSINLKPYLVKRNSVKENK